jgi:hypothetical protein
MNLTKPAYEEVLEILEIIKKELKLELDEIQEAILQNIFKLIF